jgi:hypothetical protein
MPEPWIALAGIVGSLALAEPGVTPLWLEIPESHLPLPGDCRVWYAEQPPDHQPPPIPCEAVRGRDLTGGWLVTDGRGWNPAVDWWARERVQPGSVSPAVLAAAGRSPVPGEPPRTDHVPRRYHPGHGLCRLWFPSRDPVFQPDPTVCDAIRTPAEPARLLYQGRAWALDYDWADHERRLPGTVPPVVLGISRRSATLPPAVPGG